MPSTDTDERTDEEREHWRQVRIEGIRNEGLLRRHVCPHCNAGIGEPCFSPKYYTVAYHAARRRLAGIR